VDNSSAQVILVAAAPGVDVVRRLADELQRDSLRPETATADVLRAPPRPGVYVFCFDAAIAVALATRIVEWSRGGAGVGMLGVIDDGGGDEREELLSAGFDDVVTGRTSPRELCGRVRALQRRLHRAGNDSTLRFGDFSLDLANYHLWASGTQIALTPIELAVMRELIKARGKPLSRVELLDAAWGESDLEVTERAVDNVMLRLRRKLPLPDAIETVRGVGFRLAG